MSLVCLVEFYTISYSERVCKLLDLCVIKNKNETESDEKCIERKVIVFRRFQSFR